MEEKIVVGLWGWRERKKVCGGGEIFIPRGGGGGTASRELAQEGHRKRRKKPEIGRRNKKRGTRQETRE